MMDATTTWGQAGETAQYLVSGIDSSLPFQEGSAMQTVDQVPLNAVLPVDQFVEAFVAALVLAGQREIIPRSPRALRGFQAIVDLLDRQVVRFRKEKRDWSEIWPWIETTNRLRLSSLGGVESWEHELRAAQNHFTRVFNPSYERVELAIAPATAAGELRKLNTEQRSLVNEAARQFRAEYAQAA